MTKRARDENRDLRTKILLGTDDFVVMTKSVGEIGYKRRPIDYFGQPDD